ncbi:MAG: class I SAM-dependent methyltransferase [Parachlamydia sp.]|nr:class I SAM-dependent methyltransferase [Parachlamydia sp.]
MNTGYTLLDSGNGRKLERFGRFVIARPAAQAVWRPKLAESVWNQADAIFSREGENRWLKKPSGMESWQIEVEGITFKLSATDFGHLGIFPEQRDFWAWIQSRVQKEAEKARVLNLFAYSGGSTLAAAHGGADVCHLDASKGMVTWARENALLNNLDKAPIRWIIEDVSKFIKRELRRGSRYDAIILDPPSFGRGAKGEVFKIEDEILPLLDDCRQLLSDKPLFVLFTCHTPGFTPLAMQHLMHQMMAGFEGECDTGEMVLRGSKDVLSLPSGTYARWRNG